MKVAGILALGLLSLSGCDAGAETPLNGREVANGIGVNTHTIYTDSQYADVRQTISAMKYLGLSLIRDVAPNRRLRGQSTYAVMARAGIKMNLFNGGNAPGGTQEVSEAVAGMSALEAEFPGAIHAIEGPNEVNNDRRQFEFRGLSGLPAWQAYQAALYAAVKANKTLAGKPVFKFDDFADPGRSEEFANFHSYPSPASAPLSGKLGGDMNRERARARDLPLVNTEIGAFTQPMAGAPNQIGQAQFLLMCLLDNAAEGVKETYLYQLFDAYPDPDAKNSEKHYGLFDIAYRPKASAQAIRRLVQALNGSGATSHSSALQPLEFRINAPATVHHLLVQNRSGSWSLLLWNERAVVTRAGDVTLPSDTVRIMHIPSIQRAGMTNLITGGTSPVDAKRDLVFKLGADPIVLQLDS
jgi:hypothetical protein